MLNPDVSRVAMLGWKLYPRHARHRAAVFEGAQEQATADVRILARWAAEYPGCGWYAVCGPSGIFALDLDVPPKRDGIAAMQTLTADHGPLPPRPTMRTGGGGLLLVFRDAGHPLQGKAGVPKPGIDPRRGAQTITLPPTLHHRTGQPYRWLTAPWELEPPAAPGWLLRLLAPPPEPDLPHADPRGISDRSALQAVYRAVDRVMAAGSGARNDTLNRSAYRIARLAAAGRIARGEGEAILAEAASRIGLPRLEARATIRSAFRSAFRSA